MFSLDDIIYSTVSIPKLFLGQWLKIGVTHCDIEYNERDNTMKLYPELSHDNN
jgi:hypothetical protein